MKNMSVIAVVIGGFVGAAGVVPASAMPVPAQSVDRSTDVLQARVVIKYGHWRGHRGYRYHRRGYRRHSDGFWYPMAVFGPTVVIKPGHRYRWCGPRYHRYRCR